MDIDIPGPRHIKYPLLPNTGQLHATVLGFQPAILAALFYRESRISLYIHKSNVTYTKKHREIFILPHFYPMVAQY